jgi:hypothetical protein
MLRPFVSTHLKVAEQQVIRIFVTAPIHFGCDCVDAFRARRPPRRESALEHQTETMPPLR